MEAMTPQAKAAVMQLMGQTYGQMKKQDGMLVGSSGNLQPKSNEMKSMVEQLVRAPIAPPQGAPQGYDQPAQQMPDQQGQAPVAPAPVAPAPITPEQAMAELQAVAQPSIQPVAQEVYHEEQGMLDFTEPSKMDQLIDAIKESNLLLKDIKLQLENSNVRPKRKSAKVKVTE
ncbi:hypothetical protein N9Z65_00060 [bacterium]|nr:hypothetical protein [bacterium]